MNTAAGAADREPRIVLSIIIATYNTSQLLADCLRSIRSNPPSEPYEVIVIDDASADGTSEMVRSRFPEVRLLRNEVNRHYAFSNNRAIEHARGEYLFLLNNDTIVLPKVFDRMLAFLREHPDAGAVGCKLLNEDGSVQWSVKSLPSFGAALFGARSIITRLFPNNPFSSRYLLHFDRDMTAPFVAGYVSSAAVMIPRYVIEKVGGLDERFSYHVDAEHGKRIADAGYKSYYLPTAALIHLNHRGGTMISLRRRWRSAVEFHLGSYLYYRMHVQKSAWSPMHVIVALGLAVRFVMAVSIQGCAELVRLARSSARLPGESSDPAATREP